MPASFKLLVPLCLSLSACYDDSTPYNDDTVRQSHNIFSKYKEEVPSEKAAASAREFFINNADEKRLEDVKRILRGKSVALVGPAASYEGLGLGVEIDAHDIVVRVNSGVIDHKDFHKDYGSRIDILFSVLNERNVRFLNSDHGTWKNAKLILSMQQPEASDFPMVKKHLNIGVPFYFIKEDSAFSRNLNFALPRPNTGMTAAAFLKASLAAKVDIYGFDFYGSGYNTHLTKMYTKLEKKPNELEAYSIKKLMNFIAEGLQWHKQNEQLNYFNTQLLTDPRFRWVPAQAR